MPAHAQSFPKPVSAFLLAACFVSCGKEHPPKPALKPVPPAAGLKPAMPVPGPRFHAVAMTSPKVLKQLRESLGEQRFGEVLKLNRIDLDHARQGEYLLVPTEVEDWLALSPFPRQWSALAGPPKFIAVSLRLQAWAAFEDGQQVRWGPVSTGRKTTPTYPGLYHTNWCQRERRSTFNDEWQLKWYVNLHNWNGISFHQYALPGYPDSHSCVRLAEDDSEWIYRWCQSWVLTPDQRRVEREGTPVVIFGEYPWGAPGPWKRLVEAPEDAVLSALELKEAFTLFQEQKPPPQFPDPAQRSQNPVVEGAEKAGQ